MKLPKLLARKMLVIKPEELLDYITGEFILVFDDGEIKTNAKQTFISSFCWEIIRYFPDLPLLKSFHLTSVIGLNGVYKASSHMKVAEEIVKKWYEIYPNYTHKQQHTLFTILYLITNKLYNITSVKMLNHISSMDIIDFVNIVLDPEIIKIKKEGDYSQTGIKKIQSSILKIIKTSPVFYNNYVAKFCNGGFIKSQQLAQCIGPWGYPMDVDSFPFGKPIKSGYVEGLVKFFDSLTESRTAAMALQYQDNPLKDTETFSRKCQLLGMQVQNLHRTDCGSTEYHYRVINNDVELKNMEGIWRWDEKAKKLIDIKPTDTHLIGKLVPIRSPFHCKHPDPNGICSVCFGKLSRNVFAGTNVGQQSVVSMNSVISQLVLSTKHHIGSGEVANIVLKDDMPKFFRVSSDGLGYLLNPDIIKNLIGELSSKKQIDIDDYYLVLSFKPDSLRNISDALNVKDLKLLAPDRITNISNVRFELHDRSQANTLVLYTNVDISFQNRHAYMSRDFLTYMKDEKNWTISDKGNYDVNMANFPLNAQLFKIPPKQFNTVAYSDIIQNLLEGTINEKKIRDEDTDIASFFERFAATVYEKMVFHFSVLQTIFYSIMVTSSKYNEGALPKPWTNSGIGVYDYTMGIRSLSPAMVYKCVNKLTSTTSFLVKNRPDHPFDWLFLYPQVLKFNKPIEYEQTDIR